MIMPEILTLPDDGDGSNFVDYLGMGLDYHLNIKLAKGTHILHRLHGLG